MLEVGGIAFTVAIATVILLFYLGYNVLFKKSSPTEESNSAEEEPQEHGIKSPKL
jgi:H+/gluconate symporter-like permease